MHGFEKFRSRYAYSFANGVYGFIENAEGLEDDILFDFFCNAEDVAKPNKITLLHDLIDSVISSDFDYSTGHFPDVEVDTYKGVLLEAEMELPTWLNESEVMEHIGELDNLLGDAVKKIVPSVFFILFSDRAFLKELQVLVSKYVSTLTLEEHPSILKKNGIIKRPTYVPTWLKEAIFHRDRGRCQLCWTDLTGLLIPIHKQQLDHIIPLSASGSNDPTNFQLVCADCNKKKGSKIITTNPRYAAYW